MKTVVSLVLVLGCLAAADLQPPDARTAGPDGASSAKAPVARTPDPQPRKPHFTVGRATTYITDPVDKDGSIDYAAALNARLGKGVTPTNNAAVLLWQAFGPRLDGPEVAPEFFHRLGVKLPPARGDYFVDVWEYLNKHRQLDPDSIEEVMGRWYPRCLERPWTAKEHPHIAAWLKLNEKALALVTEATRRPRYFSPIVPPTKNGRSERLLGAFLPGSLPFHRLANALVSRAMLRLGERRLDDAWQDLLACHRLGRLLTQGWSLIDVLAGLAIDGLAGRADVAFLAGSNFAGRRVEKCLQDLRGLPVMDLVAEKADRGERFFCLDLTLVLAREGLPAVDTFSSGSPDRSKLAEALWRASWSAIDWDPPLRNINRWYDRVAAVLRVPDRATRDKRLSEIRQDLKKLKVKTPNAEGLACLLQTKDRGKAVGLLVGDMLVSRMVPGLLKIQTYRDRAAQVHANLQVAFALAAYRRDHGRYPAALAALSPRYFVKVPGDLFSGKPLVYRPSSQGYLLYSVGVNGKDEQGQGPDDDPPGDDLSVRMPLPKPPDK